MTFMSESVSLLTHGWPTYKPWAEATSLWALAAVCPEVNMPGAGRPLPITFNPLAIGPSRIGFKSLVLNEMTEMLIELGINSLPGRSTVEAMYDYINGHEVRVKASVEKTVESDGTVTELNIPEHVKTAVKITSAILSRDETSGLVAETRKNYAGDELVFLSEMLSGKIPPRNTISHQLQAGGYIRVNFASACTPQVFNIIDEGFWTQGLGNRMIPVYWMPVIIEEQSILVKTTSDASDEQWFIEQRQNVKDMLAGIKKKNVQYVELDKDIADSFQLSEWTKRQKGLKDYFDDKWSILPAYEYESQIHTRKIAALRAIDRCNGDKPMVVAEDLEWAQKWMNERLVEFKIMYSDWKSSRSRDKLKTISFSAEELILDVISKKGGKATSSDVYRAVQNKMDSKLKNDTLASLVANGRVLATVNDGKTNKTVYYSIID
jgi:hypothetical protein